MLVQKATTPEELGKAIKAGADEIEITADMKNYSVKIKLKLLAGFLGQLHLLQ